MGSVLRSQVWILIAIVALILMGVTGIFTSQPTRATGWSWTNASPTIAESVVVSDISGQAICSHEYSLVRVIAEGDDKYVCRNSGGPTKVGVYYAGDHFEYVVGFARDDTTMYPLHAIGCERYDSCEYVPATDTLITRQNFTSGAFWLMIYKDFSKHMTKIVNPRTFHTEFVFSPASPDYTFTNSRGVPWQVGGIGISPNGKWLAVEFKQRGIGILNTETYEMRRITALNFEYGFGHDPHSELAITDDGQHVAVMGDNAGIAEYEAVDGCGEEVTDLVMFSIDYVQHACRSAAINRFALIQGFRSALHPHFENDGAELSFYVHSYGGEQREVILRAAGYNGPRMDYLALGDSFSSGEGETDDAYYLPGTNVEFEKCHVSTRSYPYLISAYMGIDPQYMHSVACSGATMGDVIGDDDKYKGQANRFGLLGLNFNPGQKTLAQTSARENFTPGRIHQQHFVSRYRPKVITIGIGGNDAGFMDKLRTCVGLDTCEWAAFSRHETAAEVAGIFPRLVNTYTELHKASPSSKIYVVGYPKVIDQYGACNRLDDLLLSPTEREFMDKGIEYINAVVEAAAKKAGVTYIDIENVLEGHVLCGSTQPSYMNDIALGDDSGPGGRFDWIKVIGQESFHPRPEAHQLMANRIHSIVPDLQTYSYCSEGKVICPSDTKLPRMPDYWLAFLSTKSERKLYFSRFAKDAFDDKHTNVEVTLPADSFEPGSQVSVELHSDPQTLASLTAGSNGGLVTTLTLPADTPEGYHTLHILGTAITGEQIDYYQVISYIVIPEPQSIQQQTEVKQELANNEQAKSTEPATVESVPNSTFSTVASKTLNQESGYVAGNSDNLAAATLAKSVANKPEADQKIDVIDQSSTGLVWFVVCLAVLASLVVATIVYVSTRQ